ASPRSSLRQPVTDATDAQAAYAYADARGDTASGGPDNARADGAGRSSSSGSSASAPPPLPAPLVKMPLGDDWHAVVTAMISAETIGALTRELALQSELRTQAAGIWTICVERQSLNQASACEKLLAALKGAGACVDKLQVEVGPVSDTPARRNAHAAAERQRQAEETITTDPFVQAMIRDWGGRIVPGSVKPVLQAAVKPI
ncbi:MAG: DNA polymerase III subunit gamma/tau, partial [Burkholderiales bacterium]